MSAAKGLYGGGKELASQVRLGTRFPDVFAPVASSETHPRTRPFPETDRTLPPLPDRRLRSSGWRSTRKTRAGTGTSSTRTTRTSSSRTGTTSRASSHTSSPKARTSAAAAATTSATVPLSKPPTRRTRRRRRARLRAWTTGSTPRLARPVPRRGTSSPGRATSRTEIACFSRWAAAWGTPRSRCWRSTKPRLCTAATSPSARWTSSARGATRCRRRRSATASCRSCATSRASRSPTPCRRDRWTSARWCSRSARFRPRRCVTRSATSPP